MQDSEKALVINPYSTKARIAKAEALYSMGNFEKALVEFERAWRLRQDPEIKTGLVKCRDVILNTVGDGVFTNNELLVQRVLRQMKKQEQRKDYLGPVLVGVHQLLYTSLIRKLSEC